MSTQSGGAADEAVDHRGEHLALHLAHGRALALVEIGVEPPRGDSDLKVGQEDLEDPRNRPTVLALEHPDHEFPESFGLIRVYGKDLSHVPVSFLPPPGGLANCFVLA